MKMQIQSQEDRNNFIIALANNGYKSYVVIKESYDGFIKEYFVVFEEEKS